MVGAIVADFAWPICSESANDDGQLEDETKMMRSRWNEEVELG